MAQDFNKIVTPDGREWNIWASKQDLQQAVQDPASVTALATEIAQGKSDIAGAINNKGGSASVAESFHQLAQDILAIPAVWIDGSDMVMAVDSEAGSLILEDLT